MKTKSSNQRRRFQINLMNYGGHYYTQQAVKLESLLRRKPRRLQLDLIGVGDMPGDTALLIFSLLRARSAKTHLTTNAWSSLRGSSLLVWLAGETRLIRADATVFLPRSEIYDADAKTETTCKDGQSDDADDIDPDDADYARALRVINEFLPVKEFMGRQMDVSMLRNYGLIQSDGVDRLLAAAFAKPAKMDERPPPRTVRGPRSRAWVGKTKVRDHGSK